MKNEKSVSEKNIRMFLFFSECGKWSLSADVTSLLAGSVSASPGSNIIIFEQL